MCDFSIQSFFKNAKSVTFQTMTIPNHYMWMYRDKTILYMVKLTLRLSCAMNFAIYPHDTQECKLQMESCKFSIFMSHTHIQHWHVKIDAFAILFEFFSYFTSPFLWHGIYEFIFDLLYRCGCFSVSHTTDDMIFQWDPSVPLVVDDNIELPQLALVKNHTADCEF